VSLDVSKVRPTGDRLLCRRPPPPEDAVSPGGIVIPSAWSEHATGPDAREYGFGMRRHRDLVECEVLAVGPGERDAAGVLAPMAIRPGCSVLLTGQQVDALDERHFMIRERLVLAVVHRSESATRIDAAGRSVLIERDAEEVSSGLIAIPEAHRRRRWSGTVLSVGPGDWATVCHADSGLEVLRGGSRVLRRSGDGRPYRVPVDCAPGDRVQLVPRCRSVELDVAGRTLLLVIDAGDVACVVSRAA